MEKNVSPKVRYIINSANEEAKNCGDKQVRPEHIMISIILDSENKGVMILNQMNVDIDLFYEDLDNLIKMSQYSISQKLTSKFKLPFSSESKKMLNNLDNEANKLNDNIIDTSHLVLAMLKVKNGKLISFFKKHGITYNKYIEYIKNFKSGLSDLDYELKKIEDLLKNDNLNMSTSDDFGDVFEDSNKKKKKTRTNSKTPVLDNFCVDISKAAEQNELDPVVGRVNEIKRVSQILSRRKKNNPVLIGEPGVGKSAIIEGLAMLIKDGKAPRIISNKRIYSLDLASIVAGTKYRGQFEERMKAILDELKANKDVVLFIDEMHTIVGAGNSSGGMDAANIFKPALARGEIQVIGATTLDEFRENIEKDGALTRRFQQVLVEEPSIEETKNILNNIKESYENHHKVKYTDEAIEECVKMSDRYISHRAMPDKAIDVLDEAGASRNINQETPENIKKLESEKEFINQEKMRVVKEQQYEEAAELRDKERKVNDALLIAKEDWLNNLDSHRPIVDVEHVSEVISMMTGIPVSKISSQETKKLLEMDKMLCGKIIGQDKAVQKVVNAIKRNRLGIKDKTKPISSFIFLGPTGVGKCFLGETNVKIRSKITGNEEFININNLIDKLKR
jgi:ATP-dependent Clp protease ATP-binding subunit ClpC